MTGITLVASSNRDHLLPGRRCWLVRGGMTMDELTDPIADDIERLAREAMRGEIPCDLGDACVELACDLVDAVTHRLTSPLN